MNVGDQMYCWWDTGLYDEKGRNICTILKILPYTGRYPEMFDCVLRLSAPALVKGWMERAFNTKNWSEESTNSIV